MTTWLGVAQASISVEITLRQQQHSTGRGLTTARLLARHCPDSPGTSTSTPVEAPLSFLLPTGASLIPSRIQSKVRCSYAYRCNRSLAYATLVMLVEGPLRCLSGNPLPPETDNITSEVRVMSIEEQSFAQNLLAESGTPLTLSQPRSLLKLLWYGGKSRPPNLVGSAAGATKRYAGRGSLPQGTASPPQSLRRSASRSILYLIAAF